MWRVNGGAVGFAIILGILLAPAVIAVGILVAEIAFIVAAIYIIVQSIRFLIVRPLHKLWLRRNEKRMLENEIRQHPARYMTDRQVLAHVRGQIEYPHPPGYK